MGATIQIQFYGSLRALRPPDAKSYPVDPGATVGEVLHDLAIPASRVHLTFLNGVKVDPAAPVREGDVLALFPQLGGG